jgi:uncharacterized protein GlcG (DUF336 family)
MNFRITMALAAGVLAFASCTAFAQIPQYGRNITLEEAKKVVAAAEAAARAKGWPMAIAVVDTAGLLVAFVKMDNTQNGGVMIAQDKAVASAMLRRPTKLFQDQVTGGGLGLRFQTLRYVVVNEGGIPLTIDGKIVGAIGTSGMAYNEDGMISQAGADALK